MAGETIGFRAKTHRLLVGMVLNRYVYQWLIALTQRVVTVVRAAGMRVAADELAVETL
jgi:hypothetical protein